MSAGYVYILPYALHLGGAQVGMLYISAWASALLVLATVGNAKALNRGTSDRYRLPRFFFMSSSITVLHLLARGSLAGGMFGYEKIFS